MKGFSLPVDEHEDLPTTTEEQNKESEFELERAREKVAKRAQGQRLNAYAFTVETQKDLPADVDASLQELKGLLDALGDSCVGFTKQKLAKINPPTLVGTGKAQEIAQLARAAEADYIVCDRDLSHSQVRNLEAIVRLPVLDRASVILQIFEKNAKSREARIQVGIAHLEYLLPRLSSSWISWERQGGGGSGGAARSRGAGETQMELDQRRIHERLAQMRAELRDIKKDRETQRKARRREFRVALVGYTNAGKTTLMNALTESTLPTRDGVFETLDSTVRRLKGSTNGRILVSDTVGFIRNLPHSLVASFRSTLEETAEADLLLHVVDGSDPRCASHMETTNEVLAEIGAGAVPQLVIFNKADKCTAAGEPPCAVPEGTPFLMISAKNDEDVSRCCAEISVIAGQDKEERDVTLPYEKADLLGAIYNEAEVLLRRDDDEGIYLRLRGESYVLDRVLRKL